MDFTIRHIATGKTHVISAANFKQAADKFKDIRRAEINAENAGGKQVNTMRAELNGAGAYEANGHRFHLMTTYYTPTIPPDKVAIADTRGEEAMRQGYGPEPRDYHGRWTKRDSAVAKLFKEKLAKDWAQFDAERAAGGWKGATRESKSPAARAHLTRLKNDYNRIGRAEGWDSPEALAAERKMLAAQHSFGAVKRLAKDNPTVGDVHVSSTGGGKRKARLFSVAYGGNKGKTLKTSKHADTWSRIVPITKTDEDQRLVFGWASVIEEDGEPVIDQQGDIISERELENAFYGFAKDARIAGEMHERTGVGDLVECVVFTRDKQEALGIDLGKVGAWVGFRLDADVFAKVKSGDYRSFSIGGRGMRAAA
jgi:hypothetical protein